jgi:hypothetical protein
VSIGQPDFSSVTMPGLQSLVYQSPLTTPTGGVLDYTFSLPSVTYRTLLLIVSVLHGDPISNIQVGGEGSGIIYYNQPPYLPPEIEFYDVYPVIVPIMGGIDVDMLVGVTTTSANGYLKAYGDTAQYPESVFYNGIVQAATNTANNSTATILTGPARLLTAHLELDANAIAGTGLLEINGNTMARLDQVAAADAGLDVPFTFPPNTILQERQTLVVVSSVNGLFAIGSCTYAYP